MACALSTTATFAVEQVVFKRDGKQQTTAGRLLVEATDGGLLLETADGVLRTITPGELVSRETDSAEFKPISPEAMGQQLLEELPDGFSIHTTAHYVICYNTSKAYAQWCGALYERLYRAFNNYWTYKGFELQEPEFPLVALVFSDKRSYERYASAELGEAAGAIVGYYSFKSNRVTMYDLTGTEALRAVSGKRTTSSDINRLLAHPDAEPMVATIIHEATHQIAFNCGLQTRYSDVPLWQSEGLAIYFETPDLKSSRGWRGIGAVNRGRLATFRQNRRDKAEGWLATLLADDTRMRDTRTGAAAYADAWALTYYLIRSRPKQYVDYLEMLSKKNRLVWDKPERRLDEFRAFFGSDLKRLEAAVTKQMQSLR